MSSKHPLFPRKIDDQMADLNTKLAYIIANAMRFQIVMDHIQQLQTLVGLVMAARDAAANADTRTRLDIATRNEAIKNAQDAMRKVIEFYIADSPQATAVDYEALNIPTKGYRTPLPVPDSVPGIGHITSIDLAVIVPFFDARSSKRAKPDGVYAIEAYYQLGGEQPDSISAMTERATDTASPLRLQFAFDDAYRMLYLAFRWIGTRGDYGPWSEIHKVSIAR